MAVTIDSFLGVNQQTDSYTLTLDDAWQTVEISKATAVNLTVPLNSSVAFPVNTRIFLKRTGVGVMTVVATGGVTITGSAGVLTDPGLNVEMCLRKTGTDTWALQNGVIAPVAVVSRAAVQTLTGSMASISWDTEVFDNAAIFAAGAPTRFTIPGTGAKLVKVNISVVFAANATGTRRVFLYKNNAVIGPGGTNVGLTLNAAASSVTIITTTINNYCAGGDYFEVRVDQGSGGNLDITATASIEITNLA